MMQLMELADYNPEIRRLLQYIYIADTDSRDQPA